MNRQLPNWLLPSKVLDVYGVYRKNGQVKRQLYNMALWRELLQQAGRTQDTLDPVTIDTMSFPEEEKVYFDIAEKDLARTDTNSKGPSSNIYGTLAEVTFAQLHNPESKARH